MYKDKKVYKKSIEFLLNKKADKIKHSGRTFFDHLIGVATILERWGCSFDVVMTGMFHNIYGNKYYNPHLNVSRKEVRKLIGKKSEELVWVFETTDREKIIDLKNLDLLLIKLANDYEQSNLSQTIWSNINYEVRKVKNFDLNQINNMLHKLNNYTT
tara:strand:- start:279 stop:749 length:471 start_codon:yes stop_codon:yes gene_type:complete